MDLAEIMGYIGQVGFSIVMCLLLYIKMYKDEQSHKEEINSLKTSLDNNTQALTRILERLKLD